MIIIFISILYLATDLSEYFFYIANRIGNDWTKLAAVLDVSIDIKTIQAENKSIFDQAMDFLKKFYNKHRHEASLDQVKKALQKIDRGDIVGDLVSYEAYLKSHNSSVKYQKAI